MSNREANETDCVIMSQAISENPEISVIVPIYNQETTGFLRKCLDSLVEQTFNDIEIICVDDNSTDNSLKTTLEYAKKYRNMTVVHMKQNKRQGAARNRALDIARGKYIAFVDSDDCLDSHYFEYLYEIANDYDCDAVESSFQYIDESGTLTGTLSQPHVTEVKTTLDCQATNCTILEHGMIWSYLFKSYLFSKNQIRFPEKTKYEDTPTFIRILANITTIGRAEKAIYYYRINSFSTNATTPNNPEALKERVKTALLILEYSKADEFYKEHKEALDYYFLKVGLVNTLYTISEGSLRYPNGEIRKLASTIKQNVPGISKNRYVKELPIPQRISTEIAMRYPLLYIRMRRLKNVISSF